VSNFDVASVGCGAWEPYKNLETQADWKTCSFHFFGRSLASKNNWHGLEDYSTCQLVSQYPYLSMSFCPRFAKACHLQSDLVVCVECNVCTFVIAQFHILDLLRFFLNQFQVCFCSFSVFLLSLAYRQYKVIHGNLILVVSSSFAGLGFFYQSTSAKKNIK